AYRSYHILYLRAGDDFFTQLAAVATPPSAEATAQAIRTGMFWTREAVGKLQNAAARGDHYGVLDAGRWLAYNTAMVIALANGQYYPSGRGLYPRSKQLPRRPADYDTLVDTAGGFSTADPQAVAPAALALWERLQAFVATLGITWIDEELSV